MSGRRFGTTDSVRRTFLMKCVALAGVIVALTGITATARAAVAREALDQEDVDQMKARAPHAAQLFEQGEDLAVRGELARAESLFGQARQEYPDGPLLLRRHCQVLTALGRRDDAIAACIRALEESHSNANFRALVRALVDGPSPPTPSQLAQALLIVSKERDRTAKGSPVPLGAACDIAESVGDGVMLEHCAQDLVQYAPAAPDTQRALAVLSSRCPPWRFWTGWLAFFGLFAFTVGHALRRLGRRAPVAGATGAIGLAVGLLFAALPRTAAADPDTAAEPGYLSQWTVDDKAPETKIPSEKDRNAAPLEFGYWLQDVALKAEHASRRGNHAAAARFYKALTIAVPERAVGYTKLCSEYEAMGDLDGAVAACGEALQHDGLIVKDYLNYVRLVLAKPGPVSDADVKALGDVVTHMREDPAGRGAADSVECSIATRTSNVAQLEECTNALTLSSPNDPQTVSYQWTLAMNRGRFDEARALIARGQQLGLDDTKVDGMRKATDAAITQQRKRVLLGVLAVALLAGGVWLVVGAIRRRRVVAAPPAAGAALAP